MAVRWIIGLGVALAGCGATGEEEAPLIGPDRSHGEALVIAEAQWDEVADLARAEGWTRWADVPASGSARYRGVITGWSGGGVPVDYVADLDLDVDFRDATVSGSVGNVVTEGVAGFTHPDGTIDLSGVIAPDAYGEARIVFDGSGRLRGPGMEATYSVDAAGSFVGEDARGVLGDQVTDFAWTRGDLEGTTSRSDGQFSGLARD